MTTPVLWAALSQNHPVRKTPAESRRLLYDLLADCMAERTYFTGHVFATQAEPFLGIVFVRAGYVTVVHRHAAGRERLLGVFGPSSIIGAPEVLAHDNASGTVACATEVTAGIVSDGLFRSRLAGDPRLTRLLLNVQSEAVLNQGRMLIDMVTSTARERTERFLRELALAEQRPATQQRHVSLHLPVSQRELAHLLHIVPETLCRILTALEREGIIRRRQSRLEIDLELIERAALNGRQPISDRRKVSVRTGLIAAEARSFRRRGATPSTGCTSSEAGRGEPHWKAQIQDGGRSD